MCDLKRLSFSSECPNIEKIIKNSDFVAIDTEFTGLKLHSGVKSSLFDSGAERYRKLKPAVTKFAAVQVGLSAFVRSGKANDNKYTAYTYNAFLFPVSFGPLDTRFLSQASSLEFLMKNKFDFNKFVYEGISYLNEAQESLLHNYLLENSEYDYANRDAITEDEIQTKCSLVAEWLAQNNLDSLVIYRNNDESYVSDFTLQKELRSRFPSIWTTTSEFGDIVVERISEEKREKMEQESTQSESVRKDKVMNDMLGFTLVFRMLVKYRKPLLGHNMLLDLLYFYEKFHKPLPDDYNTFKTEIHRLFPVIVDTKYMAYNLRQCLKNTGLVETTNLGCLYNTFNGPKGRYHILNSPDIEHADSHQKYLVTKMLHEAGYDAFQCGSVFLRLAHIVKNKEATYEGFTYVNTSDIPPCRFREYLTAIKSYTNHVNIPRASIQHINFGESDPIPARPDYIYVRSKSTSPLDCSKLAGLLSTYGTVDIKLLGCREALVATTNFRCYSDILHGFRGNNQMVVVRYNKWRHSSSVRLALCAGVVFCAGVCTWALLSSNTPKP